MRAELFGTASLYGLSYGLVVDWVRPRLGLVPRGRYDFQEHRLIALLRSMQMGQPTEMYLRLARAPERLLSRLR